MTKTGFGRSNVGDDVALVQDDVDDEGPDAAFGEGVAWSEKRIGKIFNTFTLSLVNWGHFYIVILSYYNEI